MRPLLFLVAVGIVAVVCCRALAGAADTKTLQGTWEVAELIVGGAKVPAKDVQGMKFIFKGQILTILPPTADTGVVEKRTFTFKLDPKQKPAAVDLTSLDGDNKGVVSPGIYEITADTLRWCQSDDEKAKERPKDFTSPEKSRVYVFTFKRGK